MNNGWEHKIADEIHVGFEFSAQTLLHGVLDFKVISIDEKKGTARTASNNIEGYLAKRADGWYEQHCHGDMRAIINVKFTPLEKITYLSHSEANGLYDDGTMRAVYEFIGDQPPCPVCGGDGEYETEYGPAGCYPCNSRLIQFVDHSGTRVYADYGDTIERHADGLHLVRTKEQ